MKSCPRIVHLGSRVVALVAWLLVEMLVGPSGVRYGCSLKRDEPRSSLALILVLDQFPRHVHRDSARAFAYDAKAREVCLSGIATGHDFALTPLERSFYYMPLEHAEDRALQERSVALFQSLRDTAGEDVREAYEHTLHYAVAHRDIVVRFGRFPHRNELLEREMTAEEADFLSQPDSSFL